MVRLGSAATHSCIAASSIYLTASQSDAEASFASQNAPLPRCRLSDDPASNQGRHKAADVNLQNREPDDWLRVNPPTQSNKSQTNEGDNGDRDTPRSAVRNYQLSEKEETAKQNRDR
jgi:hypothetical protein